MHRVLFFFPLYHFEVCHAALTVFLLFTIADEQSNLNTYVNSCIYISSKRIKVKLTTLHRGQRTQQIRISTGLGPRELTRHYSSSTVIVILLLGEGAKCHRQNPVRSDNYSSCSASFPSLCALRRRTLRSSYQAPVRCGCMVLSGVEVRHERCGVVHHVFGRGEVRAFCLGWF